MGESLPLPNDLVMLRTMSEIAVSWTALRSQYSGNRLGLSEVMPSFRSTASKTLWVAPRRRISGRATCLREFPPRPKDRT